MRFSSNSCLVSSRYLSSRFSTPPWVFFTFFKLYKWYQIVQRIAYFCRTLKALSLSRIFVEFFVKPVYPPWLVKIFKFMVFRLMENAIGSQKIESRLFTCTPYTKPKSSPGSYHHAQAEGNDSKIFENLFPPSRKGGRKLCKLSF